MTSEYGWFEFYSAAVLQTDWSKLGEFISAAEVAISERLNEFARDNGGTPEENQAIVNALNSLRVLRADLAAWSDRADVARESSRPQATHPTTS